MNIRETLHTYIAAHRLGVSMGQMLRELPLKPQQIADCAAKELRTGSLFMFKHDKSRAHYFVSQEQIDGARAELSAQWSAEVKAIADGRRESARKRSEAKRRAQGCRVRSEIPKAPKPKKVPKALTIKPSKPASSAEAFKSLPAIVPPHVKVQTLPGFTGDRWQAQVPQYGFAAMGVGRYYP